MSQTQISPLSAAQHYKAAADFWESRAKLLQHLLDEAEARAAKAEKAAVPMAEQATDPVDPA